MTAARLLLPFLLAAAGCTQEGVIAGAGGAAGVAATQERGFAAAVEDTVIALDINRRWLAHDADLFRRLDVQVTEGRALLTGLVATPEARIEAVRIAWQAEGVREVINEIQVAAGSGWSNFVRDALIANELRTKLLLDRRIRSINYSVESVNNVVYLMGIAQDAAELARAIDHARDVPHVRKVVSHVRLKGDPERGG